MSHLLCVVCLFRAAPGHYYAFVRESRATGGKSGANGADEEGPQWHICNDSGVRPVSLQDALGCHHHSDTPYMLFYRRVGADSEQHSGQQTAQSTTHDPVPSGTSLDGEHGGDDMVVVQDETKGPEEEEDLKMRQVALEAAQTQAARTIVFLPATE